MDIGATPASENEFRTRAISIYIGIAAVLLAICTMAGGNATKDAMRANIEAANTWSFFQARVIRRSLLELSSEDLALMQKSQPGLPETAQKLIAERIARNQSIAKAYTSNPERRDGADELFKKARELEAERDLALRRDPYFDYAQAMLQISIVLASVAIIAGGSALIQVSIGLGMIGTLLMLNGFTLLTRIPGIG
ncbi:MAG TPA: DUF4337 domain-containing protein [Hyphomicrobiaceae bacterium]|nr:DUF4337 domain-containing protein [Hyphomicrobiaceae bacterium]